MGLLLRATYDSLSDRGMLNEHIHNLPSLTPEDLAALQTVFDRGCEAKSIAKNSPEAEELATTIVHHFQHGIRNPQQLMRMII